MKPLLLHASSSSRHAAHRRVIHIDYAAAMLPPGLTWQTHRDGEVYARPKRKHSQSQLTNSVDAR